MLTYLSSGIKIIFNDDQKSLHIEDPSGNTWDMDGNGNITVNAPKNITLNAGQNITVTAGGSITTNAGADISEEAKGNISQSAGGDIDQSAAGDIIETADNKTEAVQQTYQHGSKKSDTYSEEITISSTKENMTLKSAKTVKANSAEKSNFF